MVKVVVASTEFGDEEFLLGEANLLGDQMRNQVIEMDDLISSLIETVSASVRGESRLTMEIAGTVRITGQVDPEQKIVCFNVFSAGADGGKSGLMRLIIETTVTPENPVLTS